MLVVDRLAGILLQMQALDADSTSSNWPSPSPSMVDLALADDRLLVLADLIALRQIGIEVVLAVEHDFRLIWALRPRPVRMAWATHSSLMTGSMPGIAASTRLTLALGSAPKAVDAPENSLDFEAPAHGPPGR
jgi:hypothetical protein